jgi:hypothetical protein
MIAPATEARALPSVGWRSDPRDPRDPRDRTDRTTRAAILARSFTGARGMAVALHETREPEPEQYAYESPHR